MVSNIPGNGISNQGISYYNSISSKMENEVVKKISGKDRGFKFNVLTFETFSERTGVDFGEIGSHFVNRPFGSILTMIHVGNDVYMKGKGADKYDVADWIDILSDEDFQEIWDCFEVNLTKYLMKLGGNTKGKKKS